MSVVHYRCFLRGKQSDFLTDNFGLYTIAQQHKGRNPRLMSCYTVGARVQLHVHLKLDTAFLPRSVPAKILEGMKGERISEVWGEEVMIRKRQLLSHHKFRGYPRIRSVVRGSLRAADDDTGEFPLGFSFA